MKEYIYINDEKFFWNKNGLLEHKETKTTFNSVIKAEKWLENILREMREEGGLE